MSVVIKLYTTATLVEIPSLSNECHVLDKSLIELELPENCLIAGVTRRENTFIPSGTWKFAEKDRLVVFTLPESIEKIEETFC